VKTIKDRLDDFKRTSGRSAQPPKSSLAFTLIELAVVIATLLILSALLLPALAGNKTTSWRTECAANMRQMGTALALYTNDHNNKYPPASYGNGSSGVTWDTCINRYLGGNAPLSALTANNLAPASLCLPVLWCPADRVPKTDPTGTHTFTWAGARRSYAENGVATPGVGLIVGDTFSSRPAHGVGGFATASGNVTDLNPPGWKTTIVQDPAGTIQIAELASYKSIQGNNWASFCAGPDWNGHSPLGGDQYCYQVDSSQPSLDTAGGGCYGGEVYRLQGNRFNYLFHDGHVAALRYTDTIGRIGAMGANPATTGDPGGMWTVTKGD
jgi:prepilin-type processing-associated H-X9-DG protein